MGRPGAISRSTHDRLTPTSFIDPVVLVLSLDKNDLETDGHLNEHFRKSA